MQLWVAVSPPRGLLPAVLRGGAASGRRSSPAVRRQRRASRMWSVLRPGWLQAVLRLRCQRTHDPERFGVTPAAVCLAVCLFGVTPAAVVAATVATFKRLMRLHYARTIGDARTTTASPQCWFWSTSVPTLAASEFLGRWSEHAGTLCSLSPSNVAGQGGRLIVHVSASSPFALL